MIISSIIEVYHKLGVSNQTGHLPNPFSPTKKLVTVDSVSQPLETETSRLVGGSFHENPIPIDPTNK